MDSATYILVDYSGSMSDSAALLQKVKSLSSGDEVPPKGHLTRLKQDIIHSLEPIVSARNYSKLVYFADSVISGGLPWARRELKEIIYNLYSHTDPKGGTALYEATKSAVDDIVEFSREKDIDKVSLILLTDGEETREDPKKSIEYLNELGASVPGADIYIIDFGNDQSFHDAVSDFIPVDASLISYQATEDEELDSDFARAVRERQSNRGANQRIFVGDRASVTINQSDNRGSLLFGGPLWRDVLVVALVSAPVSFVVNLDVAKLLFGDKGANQSVEERIEDLDERVDQLEVLTNAMTGALKSDAGRLQSIDQDILEIKRDISELRGDNP